MIKHSPLNKWLGDPTDNNARRAWISLKAADEKVPAELEKQIMILLEKQSNTYDLQRPKGKGRSTLWMITGMTDG